MATLSKGHTFSGGETVTAGKLNNLVYSATISNIVNAEIDAAAAIALSKLATGALPTGITVASANIVDGTIVNADVSGSAAIALSKLATGALPSAITVASANLVDGTIVNADVSASAAIAGTKVAPDFGSQAVVTTGTLGAGATTLAGALTLGNNNIVAGTGAGVKIGTATTQKLGFFDATPVVQPAAAAQAAAAAQTQDSLTDSTGGAASTTLAAITAPAANDTASLTDDMTAVKNALASLASQLAKIRTDVTNIKTLQDATRTALVNTGIMKGAA
jgi:hypothetical protein